MKSRTLKMQDSFITLANDQENAISTHSLHNNLLLVVIALSVRQWLTLALSLHEVK